MVLRFYYLDRFLCISLGSKFYLDTFFQLWSKLRIISLSKQGSSMKSIPEVSLFLFTAAQRIYCLGYQLFTFCICGSWLQGTLWWGSLRIWRFAHWVAAALQPTQWRVPLHSMGCKAWPVRSLLFLSTFPCIFLLPQSIVFLDKCDGYSHRRFRDYWFLSVLRSTATRQIFPVQGCLSILAFRMIFNITVITL